MSSITLSQEIMDQIYAHGEESYPYECCGALIAEQANGSEVSEIRKLKNINKDSPKTRYNIDPMDLMNLEDELDEAGLVMIGIYHSHPDHPAKPSEYDRNHAWPNLSYMVMRTTKGVTEEITSWTLDSNKQFIEETINISS